MTQDSSLQAQRSAMNDRMIRLLEAISERPGSAGAAELAQTTALPPATAYRLLAEMQNLGLIARAAEGYEIGTRLARLVLGGMSDAQYRSLVMEDLQRLADQCGETAFAARLKPSGVELFIRSLPQGGALGGVLPPLGLRPEICSAAKAILAWLPAEDRARLISDTALVVRETPARTEFEAEIAEIRRSEFATCFGLEDPDVSSFATAVPLAGKAGLFSIGIVGPRRRIEGAWLSQRDLLRRCALTLGERLRHLPEPQGLARMI